MARPQRFHHRFLPGKSGRKLRYPTLTMRYLAFRVYPIEEARTPGVNGLRNSGDFDDIDSVSKHVYTRS